MRGEQNRKAYGDRAQDPKQTEGLHTRGEA